MLSLREAAGEVEKWRKAAGFAQKHGLDYHAAAELAEMASINMRFIEVLALDALKDPDHPAASLVAVDPSASVLCVPTGMPVKDMWTKIRKQCYTAKSHWTPVGRTWVADAPEELFWPV